MLIGTEQAGQARQTFWESAFVGFHDGKERGKKWRSKGTVQFTRLMTWSFYFFASKISR